MLQSPGDPQQIRTYALYTVVGTVMLAGVIGAVTFIVGTFGDLEFRILATVLSIGFFLLLFLSTAIWVDSGLRWFTYAGAVMAAVGFVLTMGLVWMVVPTRIPDDLIKVLLSNNILLVALAITSLLLTTEGTDTFVKRFRTGSIVLVALTTAALVYMVLTETPNGMFLRATGAAAVLGAAATISTFILDKVRS